ncbi:hypothetical protein OHA72_57345 [Dactylosporangium sp. NBC_01737]|uniref:tRNA ligase subunit PheS family protein n=1 Tax=Dactylosporangium sp. NBC_01737 TaxID=2975959 RepID=UPI002E110A40|nr:hypothetical protein OHA72_57345 [Dactylosporangium sp. NBC_01737]
MSERTVFMPGSRLRVDPMAPSDGSHRGGLHPVTALLEETVRHFADLGFSPREAPELEDAWFTFDLLGVPADHPTRTSARTFYTVDGALLRSHMTSSALRVLRGGTGARRFTVAGACHRNAVPSARIVHQFHQVEAVAVGPAVRISDLTGLVLGYVAAALGSGVEARLRFRSLPYVSPGLAVDVPCTACRTVGCELCRGSGQVEVIGGGLLTAAVLRAAGLPPQLRAVALAVSLERVLAVRHGLGDIRHFLRNDPRVLNQFR